MRSRRRKLSKRLSKAVRSNLKQIWKYPGDHWPVTEREGLITISKSDITETDHNHLAQLVHLYSPIVYEINESGVDVETDSAIFHPDGYETVYCDPAMDWIIYASLDGTMSFGGEWLTGFIKKNFAGRIMNKD